MCRYILAPYILGKERSVRGKTSLCQLFCLGEKENDEAEVQLCGISPVFAFQLVCFSSCFYVVKHKTSEAFGYMFKNNSYFSFFLFKFCIRIVLYIHDYSIILVLKSVRDNGGWLRQDIRKTLLALGLLHLVIKKCRLHVEVPCNNGLHVF